MQESPAEQHDWLQQLVGDWDVESVMQDGDETMTASGTESVRALGDLWVLAEGEGQIGDGPPGRWLMTLGYDVAAGRFVGSWVGSMMTRLFVYEGELDGEEKVLTLETRGPDMKGEGNDTRYRDVIEIEGPDRRTMASRMLGDDGEWLEFMKATFSRRA